MLPGSAAEERAVLEIKVLGGLEVIRDGAPAPLPRSRKTRALLGYLALTRSPQRREQLCDMFWEVPDDPRGALRWSLSRIRRILGASVVRADRNTVSLDPAGGSLQSQIGVGVDPEVAAAYRFLAGPVRRLG